MRTTSSPTSATPSSDYKTLPFLGWCGLALAFVVMGFASQATAGDTSTVFYQYSLAVGTIVIYALIAGLSFLLALPYENPSQALGLNPFRWKWVGIAIGLIIGVLIVGAILEPFLHGGEEQGLAPDEWEPDRAGAFLVNGIVISTVVPFVEELFFRGLGVRALRFLGPAAAILITGVVFGLSHGILGALPPLALFGIAMAWVRLRSDSIWPGVMAHGAYNALGVLIIYVQLAY
jgi:membrane protease YdiL (CAAX protease family)